MLVHQVFITSYYITYKMMRPTIPVCVVFFLHLLKFASCNLLVDFYAARGDDPEVMGLRNLEKGKSDYQKANSADLYIKSGTDKQSRKCAHFHRRDGYRRYIISNIFPWPKL